MFLSKVELRRDTASTCALRSIMVRQARHDGGHSVIWTLFADDENRKRDFIWRENSLGQYYILGKDVPENHQNLWQVESKPFEPEFSPGDRLKFVLRANPTISTKAADPNRAHSKIVDVVMHAKMHCADRQAFSAEDREQAALGWLASRAQTWGVTFQHDQCSLIAYTPDKMGRRAKAVIRVAVADFEGVLTVDDPARFTGHLMTGFGRAKAWGCGLMLIRRA